MDARDQVIAAAQDQSVQTADVFWNRHRRIDPPLGIGSDITNFVLLRREPVT